MRYINIEAGRHHRTCPRYLNEEQGCQDWVKQKRNKQLHVRRPRHYKCSQLNHDMWKDKLLRNKRLISTRQIYVWSAIHGSTQHGKCKPEGSNKQTVNARIRSMLTTLENKRTRDKEETALESWSSHNLRVGTQQFAGCERECARSKREVWRRLRTNFTPPRRTHHATRQLAKRHRIMKHKIKLWDHHDLCSDDGWASQNHRHHLTCFNELRRGGTDIWQTRHLDASM